MSRSTCWHCNEPIESNYNYCPDCASPVAPFHTKSGTGFISREAWPYLKSILDGSISHPSDSKMDNDLQEAFKAQLKEDVRVAFAELSIALAADEDIVFKSVDFSPILEWDSEERVEKEIPGSFLGFFRIVRCLVNTFPPEVLEKFGNSDTD